MMYQPSTYNEKEYETYSEEDENNQLIVDKLASPEEYRFEPTIDLKLDLTRQTWSDVVNEIANRYGVKMDSVLEKRLEAGVLNGPDTLRVARIFIANRTNEKIVISKFSVAKGKPYDPNYPYHPLQPGYLCSTTFYGGGQGIQKLKWYGESKLGEFQLKSNHLVIFDKYLNEVGVGYVANSYRIECSVTKGRHCVVTYCIYQK